MIELLNNGVYVSNGKVISKQNAIESFSYPSEIENAYKGTIAYSILNKHNAVAITSPKMALNIKFDALASHDITYVGIIQTAKASGLQNFPVPYVLTNCHNSLCAVGGTINEDDHLFGLSAAKKYGGIYVPANMAVIHTYMRENLAGSGKMILGSDSHTRYGAIGTLAIGEGGPELVKQLLSRTYDIGYPEVIAVILEGEVSKGVGPQDVALAIIGEVFKSGFAKNKILEFIGSGIDNLSMEFRNGIDVMTTETACLSSIWTTDYKTRDYLTTYGRANEFKQLKPATVAYYDGAIKVDLSEIEPMIALPFHPSNVYKLKDLLINPMDILSKVEEEGKKLLNNPKIDFKLTDKVVDGKILVGQGIIAGCAGGTLDNIVMASNILKNATVGADAFSLSIYPSSQPIYLELMKNGYLSELVKVGAIIKPAFCGPCFGAGDVPANNVLSIRHTTRNFESREGSKPSNGQIASVALMDSRSIAATALNHGILSSAVDIDFNDEIPTFNYDAGIYEKRVYNGFGKGNINENLIYGPNIADWPALQPLPDNLIVKLAAVINDEVTTTDELIPSGETSSYRSNPLRLAEFTLSRKCPDYVQNTKNIKVNSDNFNSGVSVPEIENALWISNLKLNGKTSYGSAIYAKKPGDGSAREQAASCQRVLGGVANFAKEYATKRYRSNVINWGMLPFVTKFIFENDDIIIIPNIRCLFEQGESRFLAKVIRKGESIDALVTIDTLTDDERDIILAGCLINYYAKQ
ncbi:MAG: hydratase [Clostridia bacterium]